MDEFKKLKEFVEREVCFAFARCDFPRKGYSIVKHAINSTDDSEIWKDYWEKHHKSHHFPDEPHICPSCLHLRDKFVGGHVTNNGKTYIAPVCDTCNKQYKYSKAEEHPFYIKTEDMVCAPEDSQF